MFSTAIYARISRDVEGEGLGVARQVAACRAKAAGLGWTDLVVYEDNDISASKAVARPAYERLLADIRSGHVTALVVYDLDRLTRKPVELESFIDLADSTGVALANVSGDVDLTTANGRMVARIKGAVARQEADRIAERTKAQKRQALESGRPLGGRYRCLGYARDWSVIEAEAETVREIFRRILAGESANRIGLDLRNRNVPTTAGGLFTALAARRVVATSRYAGFEEVDGALIPSQAPALVSEADWHAAQRSKAPRAAGVSRSYLLSGFAVCGSCMGTMSGGSGRYRCDVQVGGCGKVSISSEWLDEPIRVRVGGYHQQARFAEPVDEPADLLPEIDAVDARITSLRAAYDAGDLALEDLAPMLRREREKRAALVSEAAAGESTNVAVEEALRGLDEWTDAPLGVQRQILARYLSRVVVQPCGKGRQPRQGRDRMDVIWISGKKENLGVGMSALVDLRHMMAG